MGRSWSPPPGCARARPKASRATRLVVIFTLEYEIGSVNVIVWKSVREKQRPQVLKSRLLAVYGVWQRDEGGEVRHLIAQHLIDLTHLLGELATQSREFHKKNPELQPGFSIIQRCVVSHCLHALIVVPHCHVLPPATFVAHVALTLPAHRRLM